MRDNGIRKTINTLIDIDPACLDKSDVRETMELIRHVQGWTDAALLACTRRLHQLAAAASSGSPGADASSMIIGVLDESPRDARSVVEQASICDHHADLEDDLASGEITSNHLELMARYRSKLDPVEASDFDLQIDRLRQVARCEHLKQFERTLQQLIEKIRLDHQSNDDGQAELEQQRHQSNMKSWVDRDTGLHRFLLSMDPLRAAKFTSAYQAELASLRNRDQRSKDRFGSLQIDAVINAMSGGQAAARSTELIVIVDHETLTGERHEHSVCETLDGDRLPVATVRDLCRDSIINLFEMTETGDIGAAIDERTANRAQRRALAAMYRTCAFPECDAPFSQTRMHHVEYYSRGGQTELDNLLPLCESHHHWVHDLGWTISVEPRGRSATFTSPSGDITTTTRPDRRPSSRALAPEPVP